MHDCREHGVGYCPHYRRQMDERDVTLSVRRDRKGQEARARWLQGEPLRVILKNPLCPGDILVSSAALHSLHKTYPGRYRTDVRCAHPAIWEHNPLVAPVPEDEADLVHEWHYAAIEHSNQRPIHFLEAYHASLGAALGVDLPVTINRPLIHLSDQERGWTHQVAERLGRPTRFAIVNCGVKPCFATKKVPDALAQAVVDHFRGRVLFAQVGLAEHNSGALDGVVDLIGETDLRQLIRLASHAEFAFGPSTFLGHLMAAHRRPYVLVDAAREPASWTTYPTQTSVVKLGCLPCCRDKACWKTGKKGSECERPVAAYGGTFPQCLAMVSPGDVVRAIEGYYAGGICEY